MSTSIGSRQLSKGTYRMTPQKHKDLFDLPEERPNSMEVKIVLEKPINSSILKRLTTDLAKDEMKVVEGGKNVIIVRGTPRDFNYGAQDILDKVKKLDKGAKIVD